MQLQKYMKHSYLSKQKVINFFSHLEKLKEKCNSNERVDLIITFNRFNNVLEYKNTFSFCDKLCINKNNIFDDFWLRLKDSNTSQDNYHDIINNVQLERFALNDNYLSENSNKNIGIFEFVEKLENEEINIIVLKIEMMIKNIFDDWVNDFNKLST